MRQKSLLIKVALKLAFVFAIGLISIQVRAQGNTTAAITGTVMDEKGEGLPGATIMALHEPTGSKYATVTRIDGRYNLSNMKVGGPYKISVSFVGYKDSEKTGIILTLAQELRSDFKMETANKQLEEVVVSAARGSVINQGRTGAATTISNKQVNSLPTLSRNFTDFTRLDPRANGLSFAGRSSAYNNITIDGAMWNNVFGLQPTIGSQSNSTPISLDAIDQINVNIAPYDVRQGMSTGASINAVTRSGDNEIKGSVYYFTRDQSFVGKKVRDVESVINNFNVKQFGFRLGGPLIKNKLFFFVNAEQENRQDPPSPNFIPTRAGATGANVSTAQASDLDQLRSFLIQKFNYDPGAYENYQWETFSRKATAKIDWNISEKHKFTVKYNYLKSYRDVAPSNSGALPNGRGPSNTNIPFQASLYRINNNLNSVIAELNSNFGGKISNSFNIGFTAMRDFRESSGGIFPTVDIGNGSGQSLTSFGYEPFSANNVLDSDVFQMSDNLTLYKGKNVFTFGLAFESSKFKNGFSPNYYGGYQFASLASFYESVNTGKSTAGQFRQSYSASSTEFPFAFMNINIFSLYAQDEIAVKPNLKITAGLRADIVSYPVTAKENTNTSQLTFRDGVKINTGKFPDATVLWSPRVGFNWDVKDDRKTQVRGGIGLFSGRVPFVWLSNQVSNNGLLFGSESVNNPTNRPFNANVDAYRPTINVNNPTPATSYNVAVTDNNFKLPQIFRANIALDKTLGESGIIATLEGIYTKDVNAVYHANVNLPASTVTAKGADNRPIYYTLNAAGFPATPFNRIYGSIPTAQGGNTALKPNISDAVVMKNTNEGYSYSLTGQLQKQFNNGLYASVAYTYGDSRSVNDGGSIAQSIWRDRVISGDPNSPALSYSNFIQRHRIVANASYQFKWLNRFASTFGVVFNAAPNFQYSYTYSGDMNGDGSGGGGNDLIYIPRDQSEIFLRDITSGTTVTYSAADQWRDLNNFIGQDSYLSSRRGQYAERNGAVAPWLNTLDLKFIQDINFKAGGKINTLQFTFDIFNFGNMINNGWGVSKTPVRQALINFVGYDSSGAAATGKPVFQFPYLNTTNKTPLTTTFQDSFSIGSRWQMQFGIRYIFN